MSKKEKTPKVKKEKAPKPKKETTVKEKTTAAAKGGGDGAEEEKSGGKKKLLLILLPVVVAVAVTAAFLLPKVLGSIRGDTEGVEVEKVSQAESGEPEEGEPSAGEGEPADGPDETDGEAEELSSGEPDDREIHTGMTTAQVVGYVEGLSPTVLGLEGKDMSEYEVYASDSIVLVDGRVCTQVRVYDDSSVGTNEVQGIFFLSRDSQRILYRYDSETDSVSEVSLRPAQYDAASGTVTLTGEVESED